MQWYSGYQKMMPKAQVELLKLWDELGIPHKEKKQLSGDILAVIGFDVDPNRRSITLRPKSKDDIIAQLTRFIGPDKTKGNQ